MSARARRTLAPALGAGTLIAATLLLASPSAAAPVPRGDDDFGKWQRRLQAALETDHPDAIAEAIHGIAGTTDPRAVRMIIVVGALHPGDPVRTAVAAALAASSEDAWVEAIGEQLRSSRNDAEAIIAIEALGAIDSPACAAPLARAFETVRPNILVTTLRAARSHPSREIIEACIDVFERVEKEAGQIWAETRITLEMLTGETYLSSTDWRKWLVTRPDDWEPSRTGVSEDGAKTGVYRPKDTRSGLGLPRIFGQEVPSTRVVFVLDTSESMEKKDPTSQEEGASSGAGPTRLERAQRELIAAIEALRPEVRFNVITYSTYVSQVFPEKLVPAKASNKAKAIDAVGGLKPAGHTNSGEALLTAMDIPEVDTIIFLSDGSPTIPGKGTMADIPPIIEAVMVANRTKKITIHTLGFTGALVSFMKAIAHGTGGTYAGIR